MITRNDITCSQCGGDLEFSIKYQNIKCPYCGYEEEIIKSQNIESHRLSQAKEWAEYSNRNKEKSVSCESCGSVSIVPYLAKTIRCTYCGSSNFNVVEDKNFMEPDCIIPFRKDKYEVDEIFKKWVSTRFWAPKDFKLMYQEGKLNPNYSPAWSYNANTRYYYRGKGGKVTSYKVKEGDKTVTKYKTTWYSTSGSGSKYFEKIFVSDSSKNNELIRGILDEGGLDLYKYDPKYLYSFGSEHYYKGVEACYPESQGIMRQQIKSLVREEILRRYDKAEIENLDVNFSDVTFNQILVPVWSSIFYYNGKEYRVVINGYNGDIEGDSPISKVKVTIAVIIFILLAMIFFVNIN